MIFNDHVDVVRGAVVEEDETQCLTLGCVKTAKFMGPENWRMYDDA